ncbi:unnamed protein product [Ixodes pacificus]
MVLVDLLQCFFAKCANPDADVRGYHVHEAESSHHFELVDVQPGVHEDEVHLSEGEGHLEHGIDAQEHAVARRRRGNFEERPELQAIVNHRPEAKGYGTDPEEQAAMAAVVLGDALLLEPRRQRSVAVEALRRALRLVAYPT